MFVKISLRFGHHPHIILADFLKISCFNQPLNILLAANTFIKDINYLKIFFNVQCHFYTHPIWSLSEKGNQWEKPRE
jgi:hypothetical protein